MTLDQARRDYHSDPMFRRVVDTIRQWIEATHVTPAEARTAAMLAAVMVEETRPAVQYFPKLRTLADGHVVIDTDGWPEPYPGGMGKG